MTFDDPQIVERPYQRSEHGEDGRTVCCMVCAASSTCITELAVKAHRKRHARQREHAQGHDPGMKQVCSTLPRLLRLLALTAWLGAGMAHASDYVEISQLLKTARPPKP